MLTSILPWWVPLVRGIVSLLVGVAMLTWPDKSAYVVVMLLGLFAVLTGLLGLISVTGVRHIAWGTSLASSLLTVSVGLLAWLAPDLTADIFVYLLAVWAFVSGVLELVAAGALLGTAEAMARGLGIISIAFSVALFFKPGVGVEAASLLVGLYLVGTGVVIIQHAFAARSLTRGPRLIPPV